MSHLQEDFLIVVNSSNEANLTTLYLVEQHFLWNFYLFASGFLACFENPFADYQTEFLPAKNRINNLRKHNKLYLHLIAPKCLSNHVKLISKFF